MGSGKPGWLKTTIPLPGKVKNVRTILRDYGVATVCDEARCPNRGDCFSRGTATFLILGTVCTRSCRYCSVTHGKPSMQPDPLEPQRVAMAVRDMEIRHAVITSVTRDDLPDRGVEQFIRTADMIRRFCPGITVEILVPDMNGADRSTLESLFRIRPDVFNHNIELVESLFTKLRPEGNYGLSLDLLRKAKIAGLSTKSGLMIGLGETYDEIKVTLQDLRDAGCTGITVGQYLMSSSSGQPVIRYYTPDEFASIENMCRGMGFASIASSPFARSSFHAGPLPVQDIT